MKDEVFRFFEEKGYNFARMKKNNRHRLKPYHIKAGMVDVYNRRHEYRDDQLGRAALREAEKIEGREEYEEELKLNQAIKDLVKERQRNQNLKEKLVLFYALLIYFATIAGIILYPYMENIK